jgi:predicted  nucleic acid-binding Zn-ribbon protein
VGIKKFINSAIESLGLDDFEKTGKKKSIKRLLGKLREREETLNKKLKKDPGKKEAKELNEELAIIKLQIKKGEKIMEQLNTPS